MTEKILVIKLGALGDMFQAFGAMRAVRAHHKDAYIAILTTKSFTGILEKSGLFDEIIVDEKAKWFEPLKLLSLIRTLKTYGFTRVYDLQNNDRTFLYFRLWQPRCEWVGAIKGASHAYTNPDRNAGHAFYGHKKLLENAGLVNVTCDTLDWLTADLSVLHLPRTYAVLVVGSAPQHPQKRWGHYRDLATALTTKNITPVLIGTEAERDAIEAVRAVCPSAISLLGKTKLMDLPELARGATYVIGNDTGPMHMMAPTGVRTIVIMGGYSNPRRHYPIGDNVTILHEDNINAISVSQVLASLK